MGERKIYALDMESLAALQSAASGSSGGGQGGGMEARLAKVEASVGHIESDIREIKNDLRVLLCGLIASFLILAGMMVTAYFRISDQIAAATHASPPAVTTQNNQSP